MRRAAKVDGNQKEIVKALRKVGYTVSHTHQIGQGFPDVIVGARGMNFLFEIKNGEKPPSKRALTEDEKVFHDTWKGQVNIVTTFEEILQIVQGKRQ